MGGIEEISIQELENLFEENSTNNPLERSVFEKAIIYAYESLRLNESAIIKTC
ncbi:hypothetical protein MASR1M31_21560 [Porphyromonadaceae bacterium]